MTLKYFSIARTVAIVCAIFATTLQIANASPSSVASVDLDKLTAKPKKETSPNVARKSEIDSIHHTLSQTHRGLTECDIDLVTKYVLIRGRYLSDISEQCRLMRLGHLYFNYRLKSIELVSLSDRQATVNIETFVTYQFTANMKKPSTELRSESWFLVKSAGRWQISRFLIKNSAAVGEYELPNY